MGLHELPTHKLLLRPYAKIKFARLFSANPQPDTIDFDKLQNIVATFIPTTVTGGIWHT